MVRQEDDERGPLCFRVLGPLQVQGDEPVTVTARRQSVVLSLLLLSPNQVVALKSMIDAVWGETPPTTARAQVQTAVSVLRRSLARAGLGERIRMQGTGYLIDLTPGELDLHVFADLVARGRAAGVARDPQAARTAFRAALALWRGEPLCDVDSDAVRAKLVRIAERRVEVLEECIEAELDLGLHHEVIGEIRALVAEYPLRERPAGQLMRALHRSGRQAEALATFQAVRKTFVDELGLEPSPALHRLELAILTGADQLATPVAAGPGPQLRMPVPRMLPARTPDFTGRAEMLHLLRHRLGDATGTGRNRHSFDVAVITGFVGVGKSTVAIETAHALAGEFPDGQLYARMPPGPDGAAEVLERFLRSLGFPMSTIPETLDGREALYRSALADRRMLVVIEDVTDPTQARPLLPGTPACRLIVTTRARRAWLPGAHVFEIDRLDAHDGIELLAAMVGRDRVAAEPSKALELVELCGGLPLALRIAANRLAARPHWSLGQLTARLVEPGQRLGGLVHQGLDVRAGLRGTYDALPPAAQLLFRHLGELETDTFAAWVAAPLLQLDADSAAEVLETLIDARLVDVLSGTGGATRYRLRDLVRLHARDLSLAESSAADRAAVIRRMLGGWLLLADEARVRQGGHRIARHSAAAVWPLAEPLVDAALTDPLAWYERERTALLAAVRQAARAGEVAYCWNLAAAVAALAETQSRFGEWRESNLCALEAAVRAEDRLGEAVMLYGLGRLDLCEQRLDRAAARHEVALEAFDQLGALDWRAITLRSLSAVHRMSSRPAQLVPDTRAPRRDDRHPEHRVAVGRIPFRQHQFGLASGMAEDQ